MKDYVITEFDEESGEWEIVYDSRSFDELIKQVATPKPAETDATPEAEPPGDATPASSE